MFLILLRFIDMINDLKLSFRLIDLNKISTPEDKSGDPQKDTLDDVLLILLSLSS
jgi:hypothetical protein